MFVSNPASVVLDYKQFKVVHCAEANGMFEIFLWRRGRELCICPVLIHQVLMRTEYVCIHVKPQDLLPMLSTAWLNLLSGVFVADTGLFLEASSFVLPPNS